MAARYGVPPSLNLLFDEIDARWPNRDRRTDGWYTNSRVSYGHNINENGFVHAIDVDRDGIDPNWIIGHIHHESSVMWYIIWSRTLWSNTYNWVPQPYRGSNPHTDHMHIEIRHTRTAEHFTGGWGIAPAKSGFGTAPGYSADFSPRDYRNYISSSRSQLLNASDVIEGARDAIKHLRG